MKNNLAKKINLIKVKMIYTLINTYNNINN